ncbi:hypothetical protein PYS58_22160 [Chryseobacterium indologenes]|uniref:hypothetical protein n=1 Tax=Chryseobacterium indologenes TaxID=253 RepID=UPI0023E8E9FC|nr:hypothetical protein [Chryseobacterium indologenes]WET49225.1 hypothetical protein PYS58_22160 [Chryseobacterium indologenes]
MYVKIKFALVFILLSILTKAQNIKIWIKKLDANIILHQEITNDSTFLSIDRKENKWLGKNISIKTVNYWSQAPIEFTADCCGKNTLTIKRTFLGNNIVGDRLYFRKNKGKYYFKVLKEFEQKAEQ